jgi:sulfatase maturation enzyme AslB (radical SAM superfamily)
MEGLFTAWGRILTGHAPNLSIEITRECPLRCPGCYAFGDTHLGGDVTLREVSDYKGEALVQAVLRLVEAHKPVHLSIVGGEPLVRFRELNTLLPILAARKLHTQLVTSAVRPIPVEWADLPRLQIVVSIDGLAPEHDVRRAPATYDRILKHIRGHQITVHCTVTRQQVQRPGYLEEFIRFWSDNADTRQIWVSLYTPQVGELAPEILLPADRAQVVEDLLALRTRYPKLRMPKGLIEVYRRPPASPDACVFAQTTTCVSADLERRITPCQFGGTPDCAQCGCIASAGLEAVARHRLPGGLAVGAIYWSSLRVGRVLNGIRDRVSAPPPGSPAARPSVSAAPGPTVEPQA